MFFLENVVWRWYASTSFCTDTYVEDDVFEWKTRSFYTTCTTHNIKGVLIIILTNYLFLFFAYVNFPQTMQTDLTWNRKRNLSLAKNHSNRTTNENVTSTNNNKSRNICFAFSFFFIFILLLSFAFSYTFKLSLPSPDSG